MQGSESPEGLLKYYCTNEVAFDDSINTQIQPSVRRGGTAGVANWRYVNTHPVKIWEKEQEEREGGQQEAGAWRALFTTL